MRSQLISTKRVRPYQLRIKRYEYFKGRCSEFFSFVSPPFRAQYLDDCSPKLNEARTIGNQKSRDVRVYKIRRKQSSKRPLNNCGNIRPGIRKRRKMLTRWMAWRIRIELALVYQGTPMLAAPLKGLLALVHHGTLMLASHSLIFPINTPHFFWVKNHEEKVKGNCGEKQRKVGRNSEEKIVRSQEKKKEKKKKNLSLSLQETPHQKPHPFSIIVISYG